MKIDVVICKEGLDHEDGPFELDMSLLRSTTCQNLFIFFKKDNEEVITSRKILFLINESVSLHVLNEKYPEKMSIDLTVAFYLNKGIITPNLISAFNSTSDYGVLLKLDDQSDPYSNFHSFLIDLDEIELKAKLMNNPNFVTEYIKQTVLGENIVDVSWK